MYWWPRCKITRLATPTYCRQSVSGSTVVLTTCTYIGMGWLKQICLLRKAWEQVPLKKVQTTACVGFKTFHVPSIAEYRCVK